MKEFKNLKIEVNAEQPLDEIVNELERLGFVCDGNHPNDCKFIYTVGDGTFAMYGFEFNGNYKLTTLSELKEM